MPVMPQPVNPSPNPKTVVKRSSALLGLLCCLALALIGVLANVSPAQAQLLPPANPIGVQQLITRLEPATQTTYIAPDNPAPFANPCSPASFPGCDVPGTTTNLVFGNGNNIVLEAVIAGGNRFEPAVNLLPPAGLAEDIIFRRDPRLADRQRSLLFFEYNPGPTTANIQLRPGEVGSIEEAMLSQVINRGIDNVFNNVPETPTTAGGLTFFEQTANNIQRIDYIIAAPGITVSPEQQGNIGFLILERGGNDPFKIAAITGLDGDIPTAYGPLINVPAGTWGNTTDVPVATAVLRDDLNTAPPAGEPRFRPSHVVGNLNTTQNIQGIFFPINSLIPGGNTPAANTIFGYSLFAADVNVPAANLLDISTFPINTPGNGSGGLDLVAGGFGLIERTGASNFTLSKRITSLPDPNNQLDFTQVLGTGPGVDLLRTAGIGEGLITVTDPAVQSGDQVEYTIYYANTGGTDATSVVLCDQIPQATTFAPDAFGPDQGIQAIEPSNPAGAVVNYTNASDADPGTFFAPGTPLPPVCGTDQGNGAVVANVGTVGSNQVGFVRFAATVN
jgi:uncharacterized repeat protein (TIGR01451 family)